MFWLVRVLALRTVRWWFCHAAAKLCYRNEVTQGHANHLSRNHSYYIVILSIFSWNCAFAL